MDKDVAAGIDPSTVFAEGHRHHLAGRFDDAVSCYLQVIERLPGHADAHANLGGALLALRRTAEAVVALRQALALRPDHPAARANLINLLTATAAAMTRVGRPDEAQAALAEAITLGLEDDVLVGLRRAVEGDPDDPAACNRLGNALVERGRGDEAMGLFRRALDLSPDYAEAHYNLAHGLLQRGEFARGWAEYEWRSRRHDAQRIDRYRLPRPIWDGGAGVGGTILLWPEQGMGDCIQFVRYAPLLARSGWTVVVEAPRPLKRLFQSIPGISVIGWGEAPPDYDVHCPLTGLPFRFATTVETIPATIPYLAPCPDLVARWRDRLAGLGGFKVGIVWRGNPKHQRDGRRSLDAVWFARLLDRPGIAVISLQKDAVAEELATLGPVFDAAPDLGDFADTAALIATLDLVISVDTSVGHLAGALGRPTWTLIDFAADWRWLQGRSDSPWYPTLRLFRQPALGDWRSVADQVREALRTSVASR